MKHLGNQSISATPHNKHLGDAGLSSLPALVEEFIKPGARYVSVTSDVDFLRGAANGKITKLRSLKACEIGA